MRIWRARRGARSSLDPEACREHALEFGWDVSTREFEGNLVHCRSASAEDQASAMSGERGGRPIQPKLILASRLVRESALESASSSSIRPSRTRL